jgi:transcriptional regulator with XRE-family HTH domain
MTQSELAKNAKVSLTTINRLEKGKQLPHEVNLREIAKQLGVSIGDLVYGASSKVADMTKEEFLSLLENNRKPSHGIDLSEYSEEKLRLIRLLRNVDDDQATLFIAILEGAIGAPVNKKSKSS